MRMKTGYGYVAVAMLGGWMVVAGAQVKQDAKDTGHDVAQTSKAVGHDTAKGTKTAGADTKHAAVKTGTATRNVGRRVEGKQPVPNP